MDRKPAGIFVRSLSAFLDMLFYLVTVGFVVLWIKGEFSYDWAESWNGRWLYCLYSLFLPLWWSGYVIGKRILKVKIRRIDGAKLTFKDLFLREIIGKFLLGYASWGLSSIICIIMVIIRKDKRTIHDIISGAYVS